ncbi:cupin-like domain protein [Synechococcus sp. MEDNS5]|nr:cupin-like domain protein [Synechococcus sp. MEDNS5]
MAQQAAEGWQALDWSLDTFIEKSNQEKTTFYKFDKNCMQKPILSQETIPKALEKIKLAGSQRRQKYSYYLKQVKISQFSCLLSELKLLPGFKEKIADINLWIGNESAATPWHYDLVDNVIIQLDGEKEIFLAPPSLTKIFKPQIYLRGEKEESTDFNFSKQESMEFIQKETDCCDEAIMVKLEKSDMLFIPPYWWHSAQCSSPISVSVNYFYNSQYNQKPFMLGEEVQALDVLYKISKNSCISRKAALRELINAIEM